MEGVISMIPYKFNNVKFISCKINYIIYILMGALVLTEFIGSYILRVITVTLVVLTGIFCNLEANVIMLFACMPFFNLINLKTGTTSLYYILICTFCFKYFMNKKGHYKLNKKILISFILIFYFIVDMSLVKLTWILLALPLLFTYREWFLIKNIKKIIRATSITMVLSCICGYWLLVNGRSIYIIGMVYNNGIETTRFAGMLGDSVVLGLMLNVLIASNFVLIYKNKYKIMDIFMLFSMAGFGILTFSKTFVVVLTFITFIFFISIIKNVAKRRSTVYLLGVIIFALSIGILLGINYIFDNLSNEVISNYFIRFSSQDLFTGRIGIFNHYLDKSSSSIYKLFFGMPVQEYTEPYLMSVFQYITNAHNIYIEILCLFGLPMLVIVCFAISFILIRSLRLRYNLVFLMPFLVILIYGLVLHGNLDFNYYTCLAIGLCFTYPESNKVLSSSD